MTESNGTTTGGKHTTGRTSRSEAAKHAAETRRLRKVIVPGMFVGAGLTVPEQREETAEPVVEASTTAPGEDGGDGSEPEGDDDK